ncbi:Scavenger mRNA-decapping enzyme DcpS, partial [Stegodyphus mimosarum]
MAVDLTTGTYDEEGIFSKHNDVATVAEKCSTDENFPSLKNFRTSRVIKEISENKILVLEGRFLGDDRPAIVVVEKMPFDTRDLTRLFTAESRLELKFRNNIYANYHVYPRSGFNGVNIKVIHPACENDFSEYIYQ